MDVARSSNRLNAHFPIFISKGNQNMNIYVNKDRVLFSRDAMLYGHFLEHFHRQVYGGVYDPQSPFADEDGFRQDVIEALIQIRVPILRWPGGCFVSSYHWEKGVGKTRTPFFDKAWRVEDSNAFGTDEFIKFCRKVGCEPYICTNAGTGTEEEMGNWMEYCNLESEGEYAKKRIANGYEKPHGVKYWSVGNENYGGWEIGAKGSAEWGRFVLESSKILKHIDPSCSLSAAALDDLDWNVNLLRTCWERLDWISLHGYWDHIWETNAASGYEKCMSFTAFTGNAIRRVRGLLTAMGLEKKIRIAFDEWNLRAWYHPNAHTVQQGRTKEEYLYPRDQNDDNSTYTMADAVFSACFLNECLRNADIVGMANFAPVVNTRGAIFTHPDGIVKRTTYYVFDMYSNQMGDQIIDLWDANKELYIIDSEGIKAEVDCLDTVATLDSASGHIAISVVNKHAADSKSITFHPGSYRHVRMTSLSGQSKDDYNDIGREAVKPYDNSSAIISQDETCFTVTLPPHSVNIVTVEP